MKLLILGLDAAPKRILKNIPALSRYDIQHMLAPVPLSGPSWTSIYTGLPAETHGVVDVLGRKRIWKNIASNNYADVVDRCMWSILERRGIKCALCNLPVATPIIPDVATMHITGFPADPNKLAYPQELVAGLPLDYLEMCDLAHFGTYLGNDKVWYDDWPPLIDFRMDHSVSAVLDYVMRSSVAIAEQFVHSSRGADLGFLGFTFIDRLGHMYGLTEMMRNGCSAIITAIVDVLRYAYADNVLIVSDHGFRNERDPDASLALEYHESNGVIALFSNCEKFALPDQRFTNTDVFPLVMQIFGVDEHPRASGLDDMDDVDEIVLDRLKGLGYL